MATGSASSVVRRLLILPVALAIVAGSSLLGPTPLNWDEVFARGDPDAINVYWTFRVPRTLLAAVAGAGLSVAGVVLQSLFRNPLATPYTLGIASGASLAAAIGFLLGLGGRWLWFPAHTVLAFAGAAGAMALVYLMARLRAGRDMTRLLLAGVCIAYMCAAGIMLATYLADQAVTNEIVKWMMGSLAELRRISSIEILVVLVPTLAFTVYAHRAFDLLAMGEDLAAARGVAVGATVWTSFVLVGVLTAAIVANCGPIGFVGLMVPHIARAMVGARTLPLVLTSALTGAAFLAVCDALARSLTIAELPVGVVTNILGAAFFFYLLATRDVSFADAR